MRHVRRWNRGRLFLAALVGCALAACAQETPGGTYVRPEKVLAERLEGFGGFFYSDEGFPTLLLAVEGSLTRVGEPLELPKAELTRIKDLFTEVYGEEIFYAQPPMGERPVPGEPLKEAELRVTAAQYSFAQLDGWADELNSFILGPQDGAFSAFFSIDSRDERAFVTISLEDVTDAESIRNIERLLQENKIPREAVVFEQGDVIGTTGGGSSPSPDDFSP